MLRKASLIAVFAALVFAGTAAADPPVQVFPPGYYQTGDFVTTAYGSVEVPARGAWLGFYGLQPDGTSEIVVTRGPDGSTSVLSEVSPRPIPGETITYDSDGDVLTRQAVAQPGACDSSEAGVWNKNPNGDGTFTKAPAGEWHWRARTGSYPAEEGGNITAVVDALKDAYLAWPQVHTNCSFSGSDDTISATELSATYDGSTNQGTQMDIVSGEDRCTLGQAPNVVAFGDLAGTAGASPGANIAVTCPQGSTLCIPADCSNGATRIVASADIKFNTNDYDFIADIGPNCSGRWAFRGVGTHEAGHVYGLGHVSDDQHPNQTMSLYVNKPCAQPEYTLGRGDINGIKALFDN